MQPPSLADVPNIWQKDGALRDIYILGTDIDDWERFMAFAATYPCVYKLGGSIASMPNAKEVLNNENDTHSLWIDVAAVSLHCHFFVPEEIEIDIEPSEVKGPIEHDRVLAFVAGLARAVGKPIIISSENEMENPIISYDPLRDAWVWKTDWSPL